MIDFGIPANVLLNVITAAQACAVTVPWLMVNEPALSVDPPVTEAVGDVPQVDGVPIAGAVV